MLLFECHSGVRLPGPSVVWEVDPHLTVMSYPRNWFSVISIKCLKMYKKQSQFFHSHTICSEHLLSPCQQQQQLKSYWDSDFHSLVSTFHTQLPYVVLIAQIPPYQQKKMHESESPLSIRNKLHFYSWQLF